MIVPGRSGSCPDDTRRSRPDLHRMGPILLSESLAVVLVAWLPSASRPGDPDLSANPRDRAPGSTPSASRSPMAPPYGDSPVLWFPQQAQNVSGRPALDPQANGSLQEFLRQRAGRDPRIGGQPPAEPGAMVSTRRRRATPHRLTRRRRELVSVAHGRYQHDRPRRTGRPRTACSQPRDDPVRLAASGTADQEGQPGHGSRSAARFPGIPRILLIRRKSRSHGER